MTNPIHTCRPTLLALALGAALGGLSAAANAEPVQQVSLYRNSDMSRWSDNYIEIGAGYLAVDSNTPKAFKFGEWTGLNDEGGYGALGFNYLTRSRADDAVNLRIYGQNLGLDTFKFLLEGGKQGTVWMSFGADRLTRSQLDSASFIHNNLGSNSLTYGAAAAFPTNTTTASAAQKADLKQFDITQTRDIYRIGLAGMLGKEWDFKVSVREDQREGNRVTGALFTSAILLPYQIDDKTTQVETSLAYTSKFAQAQLAYTFSSYQNDQTAFRWENPYQALAAPRQTGQMSLMPSNEMHQVSFTGALNLAKSTRVSTFLAQSISTQNEQFLPYSSAVAAPVALPRASLDGEIVNTIADLALTTRPLEKMNLKLAYQFRDSDNKTPSATYRYVAFDGGAQAPATNSTSIRTNVAISTREQKYTLDTDYEIFNRTLLRGVLERKTTEYSYNGGLGDVPSNDEDRALIELRRAISDEFTGALSYQRKERRAESYNKNQWFNTSYPSPAAPLAGTANGGSNSAAYFANNPQIRQFMYGDYNEDRVRINGNWIATEALTLQGSVDSFKQKNDIMNCSGVASDPRVAAATTAASTSASPANISWTAECLGRTGVDGNTASIDTQWQIDEALSTFLFYTYSDYRLKQRGRAWGAGTGGGQIGQADNVSRDFEAESEFQDHTFGIGSKWQITPKWELGGQYVYALSRGKTDVKLVPGSTITADFNPASLPMTENETNTLQLFAKWAYNTKLTYRFNYLYEQFRAKDWSWDNLTATSVNGVLLTGQQTPRYDSHYVGASVALSVW